MCRKTNLYHRLWYVKRNRKRVKAYIVIAFVVIILIIFFSFVESRLSISMGQISEYRMKAIVTRVVGNAINENFPDNIDYNDIVTISKDENGKVTSIQTDVAKLNKIFANVSLSVQEKLTQLSDEKLSIPLGAMLGEPIFATTGPAIKVRMIPTGSVETDFKSEFASAGINQTRHRIYVLVKTEIALGIPLLMEKRTVVTTSLPVAETVIVGEVPNYYIDMKK